MCHGVSVPGHKLTWVTNRLVERVVGVFLIRIRNSSAPKTYSYFTQRGWSRLMIYSGLQSTLLIQLFISISYFAAVGGAVTGKAGNPPLPR